MWYLLLPLVLWLYQPTAAIAGSNLSALCDQSGPCQFSPASTPLFSEYNVYPGFSQVQTLTITNRRQTSCRLTLDTNQPLSNSLAAELQLSLTSPGQVWFAGSLADFFASNHWVGDLSPNSSQVTTWTISLPQSSSNVTQNKVVNFNLSLNLVCEDAASSGGGNNPSGGSGGSGSVCSDAAPGSSPRLISVAASGPNQVTLNWQEGAGPLTYYLIAYGVSPGSYQYGNPNVGGPGTTSYVVSGLSAGQTYYFVVRSGNGCTPGSFSNEIAVSPNGQILNSPPSGFQAGVLGASTDQTPTPPSPSDAVAELAGNVAGAAANCSRYWLPLLYLIALLFNTLYLSSSRNSFRLILPLLVSGLLYLIDRYILNRSCCLVASWYCRFYWVGNIVAVIVPYLAYFRRSSR
jgi:hypothetical protein